MRAPASGFAPRLAALIGGPVAQDAPAAPVLRPASAPAFRDVPVAEEPSGEVSSATPLRVTSLSPERGPVHSPPVDARTGRPDPVPSVRAKPLVPDVAQAAPPSKPAALPLPQPQFGVDPPKMPAVVPKPPATEPRVVARRGPDPQPPKADPVAVPVPQSARLKVPLDPLPVAAAPAQPDRPQRWTALLPDDPDQLAASAAGLGLMPAKPAMSPALAPAPKTATPPPDAPIPPAQVRPPLPVAAKPKAAPTSEPAAPLMPGPTDTPEASALPLIKPMPAKPPPARPTLRPADPAQEPLPSQPPRMAPSVRVNIGTVTLVTRDAKGQVGGQLPRKSALAPVTPRAGRGHSIPRPGGF